MLNTFNFSAEQVAELLKLGDEEFYKFLIENGFVASKDDAKVFLLESLVTAKGDPSNEFPIKYFDNTEIPEDQKFVEFGGEALTDDLIKSGNALGTEELLKKMTLGTATKEERGCTICCKECESECPVKEEGHQISMEEYMEQSLETIE